MSADAGAVQADQAEATAPAPATFGSEAQVTQDEAKQRHRTHRQYCQEDRHRSLTGSARRRRAVATSTRMPPSAGVFPVVRAVLAVAQRGAAASTHLHANSPLGAFRPAPPRIVYLPGTASGFRLA
jgi:hypothetical protein